jgi:hypothetical protein
MTALVDLRVDGRKALEVEGCRCQQKWYKKEEYMVYRAKEAFIEFHGDKRNDKHYSEE